MQELFPTAVYLLCFATSSACAYLLARNYKRTFARLLLWSAFCFVFLAANNLLVVLDLLVIKTVDFKFWRLWTSFAAVCILLFGFIWDLEE